MSSPPLCVHHLTGGDPLDAQEPPGSERSMRTSSPRTLGSTRHGGRLVTGRSGIKSSTFAKIIERKQRGHDLMEHGVNATSPTV